MATSNKRYQWPIPDDWQAADGWTCCLLWWPDSPQWKAIVRGTLEHLKRGWSWDADTGSVIEVQQVAKYIPLTFDPSPEVMQLQEVQNIMACFDEVNANLDRIATALEAGNAQPPPESYPVTIPPELLSAIELIATAVFPELGAVARVLGTLEEVNP